MNYSRESLESLAARSGEAGHMLEELTHIISPGTEEFHSVWEITNRVFDSYYRSDKAA